MDRRKLSAVYEEPRFSLTDGTQCLLLGAYSTANTETVNLLTDFKEIDQANGKILQYKKLWGRLNQRGRLVKL